MKTAMTELQNTTKRQKKLCGTQKSRTDAQKSIPFLLLEDNMKLSHIRQHVLNSGSAPAYPPAIRPITRLSHSITQPGKWQERDNTHTHTPQELEIYQDPQEHAAWDQICGEFDRGGWGTTS